MREITAIFGLLLFFTTEFCILGANAAKYGSNNIVAHGSQGDMIGTVIPQGGVFKGIPYTQSPTGEYRWKNPRDPAPFPGKIWDATYFRSSCIQDCAIGLMKSACATKTSEDCLYLNVWVPTSILEETNKDDVIKGKHYVISKKYQKKNSDSLAVMVFIHGGAFIFGSGSTQIYDGKFMSSQGNVIIVTLNYRLGAFGFLVQKGGGAVGNYGIRDQIAALKWVQQNIANFGGNPNKVTIFGESAGAESVGTLMATDAAKGLFQQGIMESNPFGLSFRDTPDAERFGASFAEKLGCTAGDMKCLRAAKPDAIVKAMHTGLPIVLGPKKTLGFQAWSPVIDGNFLKELPLLAFANGRAMTIPTIIGTTQDEGLLFLSFLKKPLRWLYGAIVRYLIGPKNWFRVYFKYFPGKDNRYQLGKIITDFLFKCASRKAAFGATPQTWFYLFNQTLPTTPNTSLCYNKVCHGGELLYVFDTLEFIADKFSENEKLLGRRMVEYWTNFAKYGNPNGKTAKSNEGGHNNAIFWPQFSPNGDHNKYQSIKLEASGDSIITDEQKSICDFWDSIDLYGQRKK